MKKRKRNPQKTLAFMICFLLQHFIVWPKLTCRPATNFSSIQSNELPLNLPPGIDSYPLDVEKKINAHKKSLPVTYEPRTAP